MILIGMMLALPIASQAGSKDVLPLRVTLRGCLEGNPAIVPAPMKSKDLVNAALGRNLSAAVPRELVLALVHECGNDEAQVVVFDRLANDVVATVGKLKIEDEVHGPVSQVLVASLDIQNVGSLKHSKLAVGGKVIIGPVGCATKITAATMGSLNLRDRGTDVTIVIPSGRLNAGRKLATLP
jgi:hypothetical protein